MFNIYYQIAYVVCMAILVGLTMAIIRVSRRCKTFYKEIDRLFDLTARMSEVMAEHQEQIELLAINTEPDVEERETKDEQKNLDERYNEGMDNIFGYSVNTGIRMVDR